MLASDANCSNALVTYVNYKLGEGSITAYNWNIAFKFLNFLKVFYDSTLACSTVYEPSLSKVLSHLYNINGILTQQKNGVYLANACEKMKEKYLKYWKNIPHLFVYASLINLSLVYMEHKL